MKLPHDRGYPLSLGRSEPGHDLVEQEHARACGKCARKLQHFQIRQRQTAREIVCLGREPYA
jgi:hypothetical protein